MTTKLSSKGQVVLPRLARTRLNLSAGATLNCEVRDGTIILTPQSSETRRGESVIDEISGLRVAKRTTKSARVTTERVKALLADFP